MGLLGLVMFLALPALQNLLEGSLQREVRRLSGVVRLLRNEAVLTNSRFRLMSFLSPLRYKMEYSNFRTRGSCQVAPSILS